MTQPLCQLCGRPDPTGGYVCAHCARPTAEQLRQAADLAADADLAAAGQTRYGPTGVRSGGGDSPMLGNPAAAARLHAAANTITTWARHVAEQRGQDVPGLDRRPIVGPGCPLGWCAHPSCRAIRTRAPEHPVAVAATWLGEHIDWLRHQPYAAEALAELGAAARVIVHAADRPPDRVIVGACECGQRLYANRTAAVVRCRECGRSWDVAKSRDILRAHLAKMLATAAEIASMALHLDPDAKRQKIRHLITVWASPGRRIIEARGHNAVGDPLYLVGEVLDRLARPVRPGDDGPQPEGEAA